MEQFLDLDELHAGYRKKKIRNVSISILIFATAIIGLSSLASHPHSSNASVNLTDSTTPINNATGSAPAPSSALGQGTTNIGATTQPAPTNGDYSSSYTYSPSSIPNSGSNAPSTSNIATPDPSKCAGIRTQMANATASLDAQAAQLRSQIQTEQSYITNNSSYSWQNGYGQSTPTNTSAQQAQLQHDQQQLNSIVSQINTINNSYIPQLTGNMCS